MKPKYVSIKNLVLRDDLQYIMLLGQRSNGKSYAVKQHCLTHFWQTGKRFVYVRRWQIEVRASDVEAYFRDAPVEAITGGKYTCVTVYRGGIYLSNINEDGKTERGKQCGYIAYLSNEAHFKSQNFNDVSEVIFEEITAVAGGTGGGYLIRETERLESLISTIARKRQIRVWMIGNTISRVCPYFTEWIAGNGGASRINKQKQGTIDIYEHLTDQVNEDGTPVVIKIAVYLCEETANTSKMFFGDSAGMITKGTWQTRRYPHLPYYYKEMTKVYELLLQHLDFCFKLEVLKHKENGQLVLFIHPHNKPEDYSGRIISDRPDPSVMVTRKLDIIKKGDQLVKWCMGYNKVYFSDNLTGSDWEAVLDSMHGI